MVRPARAAGERVGTRESIGRRQNLRFDFAITFATTGAMADEITPPPASPVAQPAPRTASAAIWTLVLAVLSFTCGWLFTAIPAVICGHIARSKIRKSGGALGGKGIATTGLIFKTN
jgi:hypothetical protein